MLELRMCSDANISEYGMTREEIAWLTLRVALVVQTATKKLKLKI